MSEVNMHEWCRQQPMSKWLYWSFLHCVTVVHSGGRPTAVSNKPWFLGPLYDSLSAPAGEVIYRLMTNVVLLDDVLKGISLHSVRKHQRFLVSE